MYLCFVCYSGWEVAKIHRCRFIVVGQIIEVVGWGCRKQLQNAAEDTGRAKVTGDICRDGLDAAPQKKHGKGMIFNWGQVIASQVVPLQAVSI